MKSIYRFVLPVAAVAALAFAATMPNQTATVTVAGKTISIKYASPAVNGREGKLFGKDGQIGHDPTYPVWRAGANEATILHTDAALDLGGVNVPKGDYSLYVDVSNPNQWELVVNKQTGQWGTEYSKAQDLGRAKMTMTKPSGVVEQLKYTLTSTGGNKGKLELAWEDHAGSVPFTAK